MKNRHTALFRSLEMYRKDFLLSILNDVTEEEAERVPSSFRNNIRWNLGHIYLDQYLWIFSVTREKDDKIQQLNKWFGYGTTPNDFSEETPTYSELKEMLSRQISEIKERYGHQLEEQYPPTKYEGYSTIEQVLLRTTLHEGMHMQAIIDIKKCLRSGR